MTADVWDLVVVGAGPAGAATALGALSADPSLRVLLLDRDDFPRDKACGDGIAPHVADVLATVGAADATAGWTPLTRLELRHERQGVEGRLRRPVWVIPRRVFDARLVSHAVAAGAVLRRHRVRSVQVDHDALAVDGISAQVVVGADGDSSVVRRAVRPPSGGSPSDGRPSEGRRALALRGYAPTPTARRGVQAIVYGSRRHPSYAWAFDRGDGLSNVGYGEFSPDRDDRPTKALMLAELERLIPGSSVGGEDWRAHHLPLSGWSLETSHERVLLVGDAAGLVNPMTGEGIYYAVATGVAAGRAASAALASGRPSDAGPRYDRATRRLLRTHLRHTWAAARLSASPRIIDAGIHAAGHDPRAFDALVELGLGDGRITPRLAFRLAAALAPHPRS